MPPVLIICVGAVYIDTILAVPHFPAEDTKLRATKLVRRRGGNTANTLEVLSQLVTSATHRLHLLSVLPDMNSDATNFVRHSLPNVDLDTYGVFKELQQDAASSYIIKSEETGSRTIVSHNHIGEMTFADFQSKIGSLEGLEEGAEVWVHFEGRTPDVTLDCVKCLKGLDRKGNRRIKISVECEKPERVGMRDVAGYADLVVYSRLWAEKNHHDSAKAFLESQLEITQKGALLCCTWGSEGAFAIQKMPDSHSVESGHWADAWRPTPRRDLRVIDAVGAGDTFIAGILYGLTSNPNWGLDNKLEFANGLAGRKVYQEGFGGLKQRIKQSMEELDYVEEDDMFT